MQNVNGGQQQPSTSYDAVDLSGLIEEMDEDDSWIQ
jgi:hypothetical protein